MNIQMDASIDSDATMQWNMQHLWRSAGGQTGRHVAVHKFSIQLLMHVLHLCKCPYVPLHLTVLSTYLCKKPWKRSLIFQDFFHCRSQHVYRWKQLGLVHFPTYLFAGLLSLLKVAPLVHRHTVTWALFILAMSFIIFVV